ncbi:hypothetical protein BDV28DRAFT_27427 [Aspergillus coremiiformis]|uniref:Uncharacterized protein n=1 Tax=Aspergillus coremiiformis TaxID=138285 RepID=A0A5N6ZDH7_9EURO|nr:hypothetical protein BDV28DRAFT_27427 [Aspergillus coremiiformis]
MGYPKVPYPHRIFQNLVKPPTFLPLFSVVDTACSPFSTSVSWIRSMVIDVVGRGLPIQMVVDCHHELFPEKLSFSMVLSYVNVRSTEYSFYRQSPTGDDLPLAGGRTKFISVQQKNSLRHLTRRLTLDYFLSLSLRSSVSGSAPHRTIDQKH